MTRGICSLDDSRKLIGIAETKNIAKTAHGASVKDGSALDLSSLVSMNF